MGLLGVKVFILNGVWMVSVLFVDGFGGLLDGDKVMIKV